MKTLRPYQKRAHDATFEYFSNSDGHPLIVAPVGAGKSLLIGEFIRDACSQYPLTRILVLAHNKELLLQNEAELREQWHWAETGFYCAGLGKKVTTAPIIFASIQSIYTKAMEFKAFDLVLVDECHLISDKDDSMYQQLFKDLESKNPKVKIVGYTGTPYRADTGLLTDGKLFNDIAFEIEMQELIDEGYLCPPITPDVSTKMDITGVGTRGGDYIESQLQKAVNTEPLNAACVDEIVTLGRNRKKWLVFTSGISHCENVTNLLIESGINAAMITGKTPKEERARLIEEYKNGDIQCMVNVAVLTTGFNNPAIDLIAFMRPTRSPVLYVQCMGRGMRTAPDKTDCMVLDFGGVIDELGPIDQINIVKKGGGEGEAPTKECPNCNAIVYAAAQQCEECGHIFVGDDEINIDSKSAKGKAVLASQIEPEIGVVNFMVFTKNQKAGKKPTVRVNFGTDKGIIPIWLCYEHDGYARKKAEQTHNILCDEPCPSSVDEAMDIEHLYKPPTKIKFIKKDEKGFPRILEYIYEKKEESKDDGYEIPW